MPHTPRDFERLRTLARFLRPFARFSSDRRVLTILILIAVLVAGRAWLAEHPGSNPWAPLDLRDEPGWATRTKIAALRDDPAQCRAVLERSEVAFTSLDPVGEGACRRENRILLSEFPYAGDRPDTSCAVAAALEIWRRDSVQSAAHEIFGQDVARIDHFGSFSCRRDRHCRLCIGRRHSHCSRQRLAGRWRQGPVSPSCARWRVPSVRHRALTRL